MVTTRTTTANPAGSPRIRNVAGPAAKPTGAQPEEFQRFEGAPKKLAQVPKAKVDAKR